MATVAVKTTFIDWIEEKGWAAGHVVLATLFIALAAQIKIPLPFTPVPFTGLTFAVMLTAASLGGKRGSMSAALYLLLGALGLPAFAGGNFGAAYLMGITGGYLFALPLLAYLMGTLLEKKRSAATTLFAVFAASTFHLAFGTLWLSLFYGVENAFMIGCLPFIPIEMMKALFVIYTAKR